MFIHFVAILHQSLLTSHCVFGPNERPSSLRSPPGPVTSNWIKLNQIGSNYIEQSHRGARIFSDWCLFFVLKIFLYEIRFYQNLALTILYIILNRPLTYYTDLLLLIFYWKIWCKGHQTRPRTPSFRIQILFVKYIHNGKSFTPFIQLSRRISFQSNLEQGDQHKMSLIWSFGVR